MVYLKASTKKLKIGTIECPPYLQIFDCKDGKLDNNVGKGNQMVGKVRLPPITFQYIYTLLIRLIIEQKRRRRRDFRWEAR